MGRYLNVDALFSTGRGILGNNMFAFCLNNPVVYSDKTGNLPEWFIEEPFHKAIQDFVNYFWQIDENKTNSEGRLTTSAKAKRIVASAVKNLELSMGVGAGIFKETTILDAIALGGGAYCDVISVHVEDLLILPGYEIYQGVSATFAGHNYGFVEGGFSEYGNDLELVSSRGFYNDDTLTIFSSANYYVFGGSFRIGFDIVEFCKEFNEIVLN